MPLSRRQLSTPAQNAAEPARPRARRGRLKEPSDSASDAEDDAEARSCVKTKLWRLTPSTRPDLIHRIATGRLESEAELADRRSGGMRGVNRRSVASSDAAAASSPSDSESEDDAAAKSGRLESDSEFSDRRSGGMGGIPAGGAGPPSGATGTSSSAVKSIVAACSVRASCCSIAASRVRAARRWSSHQSVWLRCVHAPLATCVARGVRPLLSRRRPPLRSSRAAALKEFGCLLWWVWQR